MNKYLLGLLAIMALMAPAHAALDGWDNVPGDACTPAEEGHTRRNASANLDETEITLICDGTVWQSATGAENSSIWLNDGPEGPSEVYYSGGKVGVGINDPLSRLHVHDPVFSAGSPITHLSYLNGASAVRTMEIRQPLIDDNDSPFTFQTGNSFNFRVDAIDTLSISSVGRVGVGGLSNSQIADKLHVVGRIRVDNDTDAVSNGCIQYNGTTNKLEFSHDCSTFQSIGGSGGGGVGNPAYTSASLTLANRASLTFDHNLGHIPNCQVTQSSELSVISIRQLTTTQITISGWSPGLGNSVNVVVYCW